MVYDDQVEPARHHVKMSHVLLLGAIILAAVWVMGPHSSNPDQDTTSPEAASNPEDTPCPAGGPHQWTEKKSKVFLSGGGYFDYSYVVCSGCSLVIMP